MKMRSSFGVKGLVLALVLLTASAGFLLANPLKVDVSVADYVKVQGVAGNLNSVGSDTLNNMMTFWAEGFRKQYPNVNIQIEGKGSSTAPPALIEGTSQLGPMSRKMKKKEEQKFEAKYGFMPTRIGVALDSLAVFINKDNPINGLSLQQVDAIFSKTHKGGLADANGPTSRSVFTAGTLLRELTVTSRSTHCSKVIIRIP